MKINLSDEFGKTNAAQYINEETPAFDFEKIKADVRSRTTENEISKIKPKRTKLFAAFAAAIAVCTVSITALAATGTFGKIFGGYFQGDNSALSVYDGGNVRFESDVAGLEGKLLGVTGDESSFFAAIELTKNDGGTFTDEGYTNIMSGYCANTELNDEKANCCINAVSKEGRRIDLSGMKDGYDLQYTLSDDRKTMTMIIGINADGTDTANGRLTLRNNYFTAYRVVNKLTEFKTNDDTNSAEILDICRINSISPESTNLSYNGAGWDLQQIESKSYELPFLLEMDMDQETRNSMKIILKNSSAILSDPYAASETVITVSDIGINISTKYPINKELSSDELVKKFNNWDANMRMPVTINSRIIMCDGTICYFSPINSSAGTSGNGNDEKYYCTNASFRFSASPYLQADDRLMIIDKTQIEKIIYNGEAIYQK